MSTVVATQPANAGSIPSRQRMDFGAAILSYLVPGLGQVVQGRIGKGLLFLIGIYGLFFYGMFLGQWRNVYIGDTIGESPKWPRIIGNLYNRPQFAAQFWVGMAAWPAIYHYWQDAPTESHEHRQFVGELDKHGWLKRSMVAMPEDEVNRLQRDGDKRWDLGWVYTVIAGVLNILVIYDALAGPAFVDDSKTAKEPSIA